MTKLPLTKHVPPLFWLLAGAFCVLAANASALGGTSNPAEQSSPKQETKPRAAAEPPVAQAAAEPPTVVGRIGTYVITRKELEERLMTELYPYDQETYDEKAQPPDALTVLREMIAEKAMVIEARKKGTLENEVIADTVKRFRERRLVNLLAQKHVEKSQSKTTATQEEIRQKMQADPKLDAARAKAEIERAKAGTVLDEYYTQIYQKSHVKKPSQNLAKVVEIHQRLLTRPKEPRTVPWIQNSQIKNELTPEESNMVLAQYDGGKVTLKDWFIALGDMAPPRRPAINSPQAVDELLERALRLPLLVAEAESLGLDKDQTLLKEVQEYEDRRLLSEAKLAKQRLAKEPTAEQIAAYYSQNQEAFGTPKGLKIDLIWCQDLAAAKKAKAELDGGRDFESVRQQYSLEKDSKPFHTTAGSEGLFWKDLWAGEPNQVLGPLKGFYQQGIKWRIVKILEKTLGQVKPYSSQLDGMIKSRMMSQQSKDLAAQYGKELLEKYPYQIYADRIKDLDPLNIP
jgi:hypothetical protein